MNLKPCPYRHADDEGHILCDKIKSGDRAVTPNICRACPVSQINCAHLRATLEHHARPPITVRWGNGKSQVWDDFAQDSITLSSAACAEKVIPIHSPRDCAGCALRKPLVNGEQLVVNSERSTVSRRQLTAAPRVVRRAPVPAPMAQPVAQVARPLPVAQANQATPTAEARSSIVAQKIIQLQEWLAKQNRAPQQPEEENAAPMTYAQRPRARPSASLRTGSVGEEKRVGWTD